MSEEQEAPSMDGEELSETDWYQWLKEYLKFPFTAERIDDADEAYFDENFQDEPFRLGHRMEILGLDEADEDDGILVNVREGEEEGTVPLADLEVRPENDPNHKPVSDYAEWFTNRY